jgi:hypothetical protein
MPKKMGRTSSTQGETSNKYVYYFGSSLKRPFGRRKNRWAGNINIEFKK